MREHYDVIVIGSGPGGEGAAMTASIADAGSEAPALRIAIVITAATATVVTANAMVSTSNRSTTVAATRRPGAAQLPWRHAKPCGSGSRVRGSANHADRSRQALDARDPQ